MDLNDVTAINTVSVSTMIWVTFDFYALHCYPNAPDEVAYLRHPHRHKFCVKAQVQVFHDDRDIEFIMLKDYLRDKVVESDQSYKSCEMMCDFIHDVITEKHPEKRNIIIEVSEDGENGAIKTYTPV